MNRNVIKELIYILLAVIVGVLVVKFIIWLLPVILVAILAYMIYRAIKKNKNVNVYVNRNTNTNTNKKKPIKVIHDLDDED